MGKKLFEDLKNKAVNWKQSVYSDFNDTASYIVVNCDSPDGDQSLQLVFDVETKLPVSVKQTLNVKKSDVKEIEFSQIEYNLELPERLFDFQIPDNAEVIYENENSGDANSN